MEKFIIVAAAYGFMFLVVELLAARLKAHGEATRKLSHILAGVGAALLPFVLSFQEIALLGALFVPAVWISMRSNIFRSIHGVKRATNGEVYFPLAVAICALLFPDKLLFIYGVLVIGVADALASLIGQRYGRKKYKLKKEHKKSYIGSAAFFVTTLVIGFLLVTSFTDTPFGDTLWWSAVLAAILTLIEARAAKGLDNLLVPVAASGLLGFLTAFGILGS